jgi:polyhydroxyalkanoate synthase
MPTQLRARADKIIRGAANLSKDELTRLAASIDDGVMQKLDQFQRGISFYQNHNFTRPKPRAKIIAQNGRIKLWDYGAKSKSAPTMFIIPSLVNRAYILDLRADKSFVQYLKSHGLRPLLLDWGEPGAREK